MNNIKYVGMDVHKQITVIVVINENGQVQSTTKVRTKSGNLTEYFRGLSGTINVALEEGCQASWLYHLLEPLVSSVTVCNKRGEKKDNKNDEKDAEELAKNLRIGKLKSVYKGNQREEELKQLCRSYETLVGDSTRAQNRVKSIYRSQGIDCGGKLVYRSDLREQWLSKLPNNALRFRAMLLLEQMESISRLRKRAKKEFIDQAKQNSDYKILLTLPGFGPVRTAQLIGNVVTPHRFRTKRQFWPYCGFAAVTQSSADFGIMDKRIVKKRKKVFTLGLNRNHNPQVKQIFKGAALTALNNEYVKSYFEQLKENGLKTEIAIVSVARKLSAIALVMWKRKKEFDAKISFTKA